MFGDNAANIGTIEIDVAAVRGNQLSNHGLIRRFLCPISADLIEEYRAFKISVVL